MRRTSEAHHPPSAHQNGSLEAYLSPESGNPDFSYLSIKDLLEARESFHVHLARKQNVIGTAVGRYLIRDTDPDRDDANAAFRIAGAAARAAHGPSAASQPGRGSRDPQPATGARTLEHSVVRPWSWPCVLVFVRQWLPRQAFFDQLEDYIPPFLYLPDGRIIPTCVVEARPSSQPAGPSSLAHGASRDNRRLLRGGDPLVTYDQVQERFGTATCLVTDGAATYALTAAHVAGSPGTPVWSPLQAQSVGVSGPQIKKCLFSQAYEGLPSTRTFCFLDAGLVRLENVHQWSPEVRTIGRLGEPIDLSVDTLSLKHIGLPLRGFGAASGEITGRVLALFFRYRTLAGYDYIADLLIGPHPGSDQPLSTHPGDSGTLFVFDAPRALADRSSGEHDAALRTEVEQAVREQGWRPVAMQWGGQRFTGAAADAPGAVYPFAMATNVSSILRQLDVEIIRAGDLGLPEYWGEIGHFTIGEKACDLVTSASLQQLLRANQRTIGFDDRIISGDDETPDFAPLSDVPDLVWKSRRQGSRGRKDNPTHSANLEYPADGKSPQIRDVPLDPKAWAKLYADNGVRSDFQEEGKGTNPFYQSERGSLPFRVRQIFEETVKFVQAGDVQRFVCAAGILAHYVGDACQPLHGTIHFNDEGCHSPYETAMLGRHRGDVPGAVAAALGDRKAATAIADGPAAAQATMDLMARAQQLLPWQTILDSFVRAGKPKKETSPGLDPMWGELGAATGACMAEGALLLASLWQSAWNLGQGENTLAAAANAIPYEALQAIFLDKNFLPSFSLDEYAF